MEKLKNASIKEVSVMSALIAKFYGEKAREHFIASLLSQMHTNKKPIAIFFAPA